MATTTHEKTVQTPKASDIEIARAASLLHICTRRRSLADQARPVHRRTGAPRPVKGCFSICSLPAGNAVQLTAIQPEITTQQAATCRRRVHVEVGGGGNPKPSGATPTAALDDDGLQEGSTASDCCSMADVASQNPACMTMSRANERPGRCLRCLRPILGAVARPADAANFGRSLCRALVGGDSR